jgi:hypothetical protein
MINSHTQDRTLADHASPAPRSSQGNQHFTLATKETLLPTAPRSGEGQ